MIESLVSTSFQVRSRMDMRCLRIFPKNASELYSSASRRSRRFEMILMTNRGRIVHRLKYDDDP